MKYDIPSNSAKVIKNTFLLNCKNDYLSVDALVFFLRNGMMQNHQVPDKLKAYIFDTIRGKNPKWEDYKNKNHESFKS